MYCLKCKTSKMDKARNSHHYTQCGLDNVWLVNWEGFFCPSCNMFVAVLPEASILVSLIAYRLLVLERHLNGDEILFLRKLLGLKPFTLADVLCIDKSKLVRWENNKDTIDPLSDKKLREKALEKISPSSSPEILKQIMSIYHRGFKSGEVEEITIKKEDLSVMTA